MESAVFAYTVGISNFCGVVSTLLASGIVKWSGMKTIGNDCNFEALPYLIALCQMIIPMCIGLPAIYLIPNKFQTEHLMTWPEEWNGEPEQSNADEDTEGLSEAESATMT